jgi:hypothetical protein
MGDELVGDILEANEERVICTMTEDSYKPTPHAIVLKIYILLYNMDSFTT